MVGCCYLCLELRTGYLIYENSPFEKLIRAAAAESATGRVALSYMVLIYNTMVLDDAEYFGKLYMLR